MVLTNPFTCFVAAYQIRIPFFSSKDKTSNTLLIVNTVNSTHHCLLQPTQIKAELFLCLLFHLMPVHVYVWESCNLDISLQWNKDILSVQFITMRAHYITYNTSGYRGILFPVDKNPFSPFSHSTLCLLSILMNALLNTQREGSVKKKKQKALRVQVERGIALIGALSITLNAGK